MEDEAKTESFRDWDALPDDLLRNIGDLLDLRCCIWFRGVCRSWRAALPGLPPPWLVIPGGWCRCDDMVDLGFLSPPSPAGAQWLTANNPCIGSSAGWLAFLHMSLIVFLVNPVTHAQVRLPPLRRRDGFLEPFPPCYCNCVVAERRRRNGELPEMEQDNLIRKIAFSANPTAEDHAVAVLCRWGFGLAFIKAGLDRWQWVHWPDATGRSGIGGDGEATDGCSNTDLDITYHHGKFYYMTQCGQIWSIDPAAPPPVVPVPVAKCCPPAPESSMMPGKHLAFTQDGTLHVVWGDGPGLIPRDDTRNRPMRMHVQRYHPDSSWTTAPHLSGQAFLIGNRSQSLGVPASVVSAPSTWIRPNCVYFTCIVPGSDLEETFDDHHADIWEFDVNTGLFRVVSRKQDFPDSVEWAKAIWFTPSLVW
uniref:Uncharacterized protein n=1 Tax=Avena sativa TaxID=4498 RepID=A0ACD5WD89_AVESA